MPRLRKLLGKPDSIRSYSTNLEGLVLPRQLIGLEMETENVEVQSERDADNLFTSLSLWSHKQDGSLRNKGREFVTIDSGLFGDDLIVAIKQYFEEAKKQEWEVSDRTSIHVHMDVSDMDTAKNFYFLCILYAYFEKVLFRFVGQGRDTSTFCLPWHKAQKSLTTVIKICQASGEETNEALLALLKQYQHDEKYSALNVGSLSSYGTIEFRHLANEMNQEKLLAWINMLMSMRKAADSFADKYNAPEKLLKALMTTNPELVTRNIFGERLAMLLFYDGMANDMKSCIKTMYDLVYLSTPERKWDYKKPPKPKGDTPFQKFYKKLPKTVDKIAPQPEPEPIEFEEGEP